MLLLQLFVNTTILKIYIRGHNITKIREIFIKKYYSQSSKKIYKDYDRMINKWDKMRGVTFNSIFLIFKIFIIINIFIFCCFTFKMLHFHIEKNIAPFTQIIVCIGFISIIGIIILYIIFKNCGNHLIDTTKI